MRIHRRGIGPILAGAVMIMFPPASHADGESISTGPGVGASIPAFEAPDQTGALRRFEDLRGDDGLLLLFFRSVDW